MSKNIFDIESNSISILVHTEAIMNDPGALEYFCLASKLSPISVYFMPITHSEDMVSLNTGKYEQQQEADASFVSLVFPQCAVHVCSFRNTEYKENSESYAKRTEAYILSGRFSSHLFDYIVTNQPNTVVVEPETPIVDVRQCKEILRLFLIHSKQYMLTEYFTIDEFGYYLYKHKEVFSEFQNFWSAVCTNGVIDDWAVALDNRLKLITLCIDKCMIEANKTQNNKTAMHLQYHVAYLLLLVTGTFDNLAWIINKQYKLNLKKFDVDLRKEKFCDTIKPLSQALHQIVTSDPFTSEIEAIRELRDCIVHREFIQSGTGVDIRKRSQNSYLFVDRGVYDLLLKAGLKTDKHTFVSKDNAFVLFEDFIGFTKDVIIRIVNSIIKIIAEEMYGAHNNYVMWRLFHFPSKPYVL